VPSYRFEIVGAQPADALEPYVDAFPAYLEQVCRYWPELAQTALAFAPPSGVPQGIIPITISDEVDDAAALAYHTRNIFGAVSCLVERQQCIKYNQPLGPATIHEVLEAGINPELARYITAPLGSNPAERKLPYEIVDPTCFSFIQVNGVNFPNVSTPAFWVPDSGGPFDLAGVVESPLPIIPKGIGAIEDDTGTLEYGDLVPDQISYLKERRGRRFALRSSTVLI
jgi:hypothetical protein